ncbi:uncharacterized protein ColSpa_03181 [Colletotrichum spaethianum]|uniref:Uncharacterized protein n=1 Tax=Colletotrichum spaethianum TaxID=700344 RepID=A0AA37LBM8_9PEZI|nr:uncharacterized protein ColSpa_03181 [Colletotrichum spaethianum]GKT43000.1 hypothetical protein ColSpa_03181 [Colletotrichum spaethianum]
MNAHELIQKSLKDLFNGYATTLEWYQEWAPIAENPTLVRVYNKARRHDPPKMPQFDMQDIFDAIALGMSTVLRRCTSPMGLDNLAGRVTAGYVYLLLSYHDVVEPQETA